MHVLDSSQKKNGHPTVSIMQNSVNVTDDRDSRRQIIPCPLLLFSIQLCRHSLLSWPAIWSIKGRRGGRGVTHTNTQRSVCPPALTQRVCLLLACVVALYLKQGRARKPQNRRAFLPPSSTTTTPRGRTQCCTHSFTVESKSLGTFT